MWFLFGPNAIILIPALILAIYAQWRVRSTYAKYSKVETLGRMQAQDVAQRILRGAMITNVTIEPSPRQLSDNYDPRKRVLHLSAPTSTSVAAIGIAAHEAGHAMQHAQNYSFLSVRSMIVPVANFGSQLAFPLFFIGLFAGVPALVTAGIVAFSAAVLFTLVTLPVEFDASRRAIVALRSSGALSEEEVGGAKEVLFAAALTYVAAAAMAALQLVLLLSAGRRR
jgi:Zn-dependent membrane protease YugP